MARAAALGRRVTAVFNFASPKAVEDFRERTRRLTGRELHDHRLVTLPFLKPDDPRRASGAAEVRELLAGLIAAAPRIRAEARAGAALALGAARGCDMELLADVLPAAERALLYAHAGEAGEDDFGGEFEGGDER